MNFLKTLDWNTALHEGQNTLDLLALGIRFGYILDSIPPPHCTDLLIIRSIIQVIIFGSLLKLQNIPWWPSWQHYPCAKDYIVETIFVILQVF